MCTLRVALMNVHKANAMNFTYRIALRHSQVSTEVCTNLQIAVESLFRQVPYILTYGSPIIFH